MIAKCTFSSKVDLKALVACKLLSFNRVYNDLGVIIWQCDEVDTIEDNLVLFNLIL